MISAIEGSCCNSFKSQIWKMFLAWEKIQEILLWALQAKSPLVWLHWYRVKITTASEYIIYIWNFWICGKKQYCFVVSHSVYATKKNIKFQHFRFWLYWMKFGCFMGDLLSHCIICFKAKWRKHFFVASVVTDKKRPVKFLASRFHSSSQ